MDNAMIVALCLLLPFLGTVVGSASSLMLRSDPGDRIRKGLLGFAGGVMIAASVWSLLIPAIELGEGTETPWLPAALGFLIGIGFLLLLDTLVPHVHPSSEVAEGRNRKYSWRSMLMIAVTLHNIPEGMAVGAVLAGAFHGGESISLPAALTLSIGIAIQNMPEGAVISAPLISAGASKKRAFVYGMISGVVEPLGCILMLLMTAVLTPALPYIMAFAAGAMMYVVVEELIPDSQAGDHSNAGTVGAAIGFVLMMVLDIALG